MKPHILAPGTCINCGCTDEYPCIVDNRPCHWIGEADGMLVPPELWLENGPICSVCRNGIAERLYMLANGLPPPVEAYGPRDLSTLLDGDHSHPLEVRLLGGRYRELVQLAREDRLSEFDEVELSLIAELLLSQTAGPYVSLSHGVADQFA